MNKKHFLVSETFYKMEYETPCHSIFDIYQIGTWEFGVSKKVKEVTLVDVIFYFNKLIAYCPWLYVKNVSINTIDSFWATNLEETMLTYFENLYESAFFKQSLVWDIAIFECGMNLKYNNNVVILNNKREIIINCFFDSDYQKISYNLSIYIDLFTNNPSRQPNVFLSNDESEFNKKILRDSFIEIVTQKELEIISHESKFHRDIIYKYGFK